MREFTTPTGQSGTMVIRDDGINNIELLVRNPSGVEVRAIPWTFTLNGVKESLRSIDIPAGVTEQSFITLFVGSSQTVIFHLGATGSTALGGPTDLSAAIQRGALDGTVNITVGNVVRKAQPFVNVNGVWRRARPFGRDQGIWKQTS